MVPWVRVILDSKQTARNPTESIPTKFFAEHPIYVANKNGTNDKPCLIRRMHWAVTYCIEEIVSHSLCFGQKVTPLSKHASSGYWRFQTVTDGYKRLQTATRGFQAVSGV